MANWTDNTKVVRVIEALKKMPSLLNWMAECADSDEDEHDADLGDSFEFMIHQFKNIDPNTDRTMLEEMGISSKSSEIMTILASIKKSDFSDLRDGLRSVNQYEVTVRGMQGRHDEKVYDRKVYADSHLFALTVAFGYLAYIGINEAQITEAKAQRFVK